MSWSRKQENKVINFALSFLATAVRDDKSDWVRQEMLEITGSSQTHEYYNIIEQARTD